jgi:hypothetical protein
VTLVTAGAGRRSKSLAEGLTQHGRHAEECHPHCCAGNVARSSRTRPARRREPASSTCQVKVHEVLAGCYERRNGNE